MELAEFLSQVVQEAASKREAGFKAFLKVAGEWHSEALAQGVKIFVTEMAADLALDVPLLDRDGDSRLPIFKLWGCALCGCALCALQFAAFGVRVGLNSLGTQAHLSGTTEHQPRSPWLPGRVGTKAAGQEPSVPEPGL